MKKYFVFLSLLMFGFSLSLPCRVSADTVTSSAASKLITTDIVNQFEAAAGPKGAGYNSGNPGSNYQDPRVTIANIIRYALSFVGTLFIALTVYAGILWMTASGNDDQVTKAKKLIFQAVIGLFITFSAYTITLLAYRLATGKYTPTNCRTSDSGSIDSNNCTVAPGN